MGLQALARIYGLGSGRDSWASRSAQTHEGPAPGPGKKEGHMGQLDEDGWPDFELFQGGCGAIDWPRGRSHWHAIGVHAQIAEAMVSRAPYPNEVGFHDPAVRG